RFVRQFPTGAPQSRIDLAAAAPFTRGASNRDRLPLEERRGRQPGQRRLLCGNKPFSVLYRRRLDRPADCRVVVVPSVRAESAAHLPFHNSRKRTPDDLLRCGITLLPCPLDTAR